MTRDEVSFGKELGRLCGSAEARRDAKRKLAVEAPRWGVLDRRASERIGALIDNMLLRRCEA
jgi:hypothetical protein